MSTGQRLHLRLFLEGIEVPVISAMTTGAIGSSAVAQIEIIPTDAGLLLLPRTLVTLFFLDWERYIFENPGGSESDDIPDEYYGLLFVGELFTVSYSKSGYGTRSLVLQCLDCSNIWDTLYLILLQYSSANPTIIVGNQAGFTGSSEALDDLANQPEMVIAKMISDSSQSAASPGLRSTGGTLGALFAVLELAGGVHGVHRGINDWATITERRLRLMDQVGSDSGETARLVFEQSVLEDWIQNALGNSGTVISFRDLLQLIFRYVYYDVVANPVASYFAGVSKPATVRNRPVEGNGIIQVPGKDINELQPLLRQKVIYVLQELLAKGYEPRITSTIRTDNQRSLHFDGHAVDIGMAAFSTDWDARLLVSNGGTASQRISPGARRGTVLPYYDEEGNGGWYGRVHRALKQGRGLLSLSERDREQYAILRSFFLEMGSLADKYGLGWGGKIHSIYGVTLDGSQGGPKIEYVWSSMGVGVDPVHLEISREESGVAYEEIPDFGTEPRERLITQVFRPDVWFVAPPVVNVIFPEEYNSFNYTRDMLRETTRLQLTTFNSMVNDELLHNYFFAPKFKNGDNLDAVGIGSARKGVIFPHERLSGIIPKMEQIPEVAFYAAATANGSSTLVSEAGESPIVQWAGRVAAFNLLRNRYSARRASVSGRFMPRLLLGWPAAVIDRLPSAGADKPIQFLGLVTSLTHSLSQGGGQTSIGLSFVRSHRSGDENDELFNEVLFADNPLDIVRTETLITDFVVEDEVAPGVTQDFIRAVDLLLASADPPLASDYYLKNPPTGYLGPKGNKVVEIRITDDTEKVCVFLGFDGTPEEVTVPFTSFQILEEGKPLPLEEAIRPPWFSTEYTNAEIGPKLYAKNYGTRSILEATGEENVEAAVNSVVTEYAQHQGTQSTGWVWAKTHRRFASIPEVMGSFHKWAYGPYGNLEGLDLDDLLGFPLDPDRDTANRPIDAKVDPRLRRHTQVLAYLNELLAQKGFRG